ncbi:hypothetical protein N8336_02040 [Flavobacteriaceae bacterium]|nr:hypothetical protein [Flavobacteriaceae bacterium]
MRIEIILFGIIILVFLIDFIVKKRKKGLIIPKQKIVSSKKKKFVLIISLFSAIVSSLLIYSYNPLFIFDKNDGVDFIDHFKFKRYHIDDIVLENSFNKELSFKLKRTMEPFSGIIYSDQGNIGLALNGKANGLFVFFNDDSINGSIKERTHYLNGKKDGQSLVWYQNQQLHKNVNYKNGSLNGSFKEFFEFGGISSEGNYANDKKIGFWRVFIGDKIELKGNYSDEYGDREGLWQITNLEKDIEVIIDYDYGLIEEIENIEELIFKYSYTRTVVPLEEVINSELWGSKKLNTKIGPMFEVYFDNIRITEYIKD